MIFNGASLSRVAFEDVSRDFEARGKCLVIGAKSEDKLPPMKKAEDVEFVFTDIIVKDEEKGNIIELDAGKLFPLDDGSIDTIICFNVLEHFENTRNFFEESKRVLKPSGELLAFTPFFYPIHYDPKDYYRFGVSFYEEWGERFGSYDLIPVSFGPVMDSLYVHMLVSYPNRFANLFFFMTFPVFLLYQSFVSLFAGSKYSQKCPLGYFFRAKK